MTMQEASLMIETLQKRIEELETENRELRQQLGVGCKDTHEKNNVLDTMTINDLGLAMNTYCAISRFLGLDVSVKEIIQHRLSEYMDLYKFGEASACDLIIALDKYGLTLPEETIQSDFVAVRKVMDRVKMMQTSVVDVGFSVRICNRMKKFGVDTVYDLARCSEVRIGRICDHNEDRFEQIVELLNEHGFHSIANKINKNRLKL